MIDCFVVVVLLLLGGFPPFTLSDYFSSWWTYLIETSPCRFLDSLRHFLASKFVPIDAHQRTTSYKQISRII